MEKTSREQDRKPAASDWRAFALPIFVSLCWFLAARHISLEWTLSEQYHFGWIVPLMALYVFWTRFENAPTPGKPPRMLAIPAGILLITLVEVLVMPLREANADWRLLGWMLTGLAAVATLLALGQTGGVPWMTHFAFPVLFFFTSVPWPCTVESALMQWLMRHNAELAAELLHWLGVVAEVQGNWIRLSSATVGVDEACSGIRSLQGSLMATLFVGEIFELGRWRRVALLLAGAGWALLTNSGRTLFLALMAERSGTPAMERWHDPAGYWILGACVAGVAFTGWLLRRGQDGGGASRWASASIGVLTEWRERLSATSRTALAGTALLLAGWVGTEGWFRMHEVAETRLIDWSFKQPTQAARFAIVEQSSHVRGEMRYDFHSGGRWCDSEGKCWVADYFRWNPGPNAVRTVIVHDPRVCLGASGKEFVRALPAVSFRADDMALPFDAYWFRDRADNVFVFNCVAEDARRRPGQEQNSDIFSIASRLDAVRTGKRNLGQRRLEVAVWGMRDPASATEAFEELLRRQVVVQ